tara:strand:+ start:6998 stop:8620 length:1623 start_codon:yes stop_codon:yes gene_type:complete
MSNSLFKDALADAKKLREIAEQNAKNSIIESIAPKIREMIEKQILGDFSDFDDEADIFESDEHDQELDLTVEAAQELQKMLGGVSDEQVELSTRRLKETVTDLTALVSAGVNEEVLEAFQAKIAELTEQKLVISEDIQTDFANEYGILWGKLDEASTQIEVAHKATVRVEALQEVFSEITGKNPADLKESELNNYITLVGIADTAIRTLIENLNTRAEYNSNNIGILTQTFTTLLENVENNKKELGTMKRSLRDLLSEERITIELDLGEDVEVDASEVVATVAEAEDEAEDAEGAEDEEAEGEEDLAVDDELDAVEDEEAAEVMVAEEDIVLEVDGDDLEAALSEMVAEMTETEDEVEEDLNESEEVELTDDTVIEISESMLREELEKIRSLNEAEEVEEDTINENEDAQEVVAEEQNDQLKENVEAYEEAIEELKGQLGEMNLFNAKLLYTNKLLMNSDLTQAQRARAIESLDEARSLREVKLLFKTLTESFNKRSKETVTESKKRVIGSASRATRAAGASLNESSEASRWATLAGICK